jgi:hypothetical protein
MADRTFWQYLKGPWHTFELHLSRTDVQLREYFEAGKDPKVTTVSLEDFLSGKLHEEINASMNAGVLAEALENARKLKQ